MRRFRHFIVATLPLVASCAGDAARAPVADAVVPPAACGPAWEDPSAVDFVGALEQATQPGPPIWGGYRLEDGYYVVFAGESPGGEACLGLWHGGRPVAFAATAEAPRMLTPLYGYHLVEGGNGGPLDALVPATEQPPAIRTWLAELEVPNAVVMPVTIEGFPIELSALMKVQLAIHEGFHVTVQVPRWLGSGGAWPAWDLQPDRPGVQACYGGTPEVEAAREHERDALDRLVAALLDDDRPAACVAGEEFLSRRGARYALLDGVGVTRHDGTPGSCAEAEAIMELEEGAADYASWAALYDLGMANRERLTARYRAQQAEWFYLSGAMQLHAVDLFAPERMLDVTREIVGSAGPDDGSPTAVLSRTLAEACR